MTERLVGLVRLPFAAGCAVVTALICFPGEFAASYLDSGDLQKALSVALANSGFTTISVSSDGFQGAARAITYAAFIFLAIYSTRSLRRRILQAEPELSPLSPKGEEGFHEAFGAVSSPGGAAVLAVLFGIVYVVPRVLSSNGPFTLLYALVGSSLNAFVIASVLWEYLYGLWGLRNFGMADINLKPYYADRMFGLRPLGSISVFFGSVLFGLSVLSLVGSSLSNDLLNMSIIITLLSVCVVMLFLPLNGIHRKMARQKLLEQAALQLRLTEAISGQNLPDGSRVESRLDEIGGLLRVHIERDEISSIPTWPFDTGIVQRLAAVTVAVITIVLARIAQLVLKL